MDIIKTHLFHDLRYVVIEIEFAGFKNFSYEDIH